MPVTPTGHFNLPQLYMKNLIAASSVFQSWVGEVTAALAKNHIYFDSIAGSPNVVSRPWALISMAGPMFDFSSSTSGAQADATFFVVFLNDINTANTDSDELQTFANTVSDIIDDMKSLQNTAPGGDLVLKIDRMNDERAVPELANDDRDTDVPRFVQIKMDVSFAHSPV